jgi:spermidine/putrescine transport system permease protein
MLMPLYTALVNMPQNIVNASYDLGRGKLSTFINVVFPYTRGALFAGMSLVFLPSLTTVAVPQFLNNNADNSLIGDTIVDFGGRAAGSGIDLARASTLSLVVLLLIGAGYMLTVLINKAIKFFVARSKE